MEDKKSKKLVQAVHKFYVLSTKPCAACSTYYKNTKNR